MCFDIACDINAPVFKRVSAVDADEKRADDRIHAAAIDPEESACYSREIVRSV